MDDNSLVEEENMTPTTEYQYPDLPPFNTRLENYIILTLLFIFISIIDFTISICLWLYYDKKNIPLINWILYTRNNSIIRRFI